MHSNPDRPRAAKEANMPLSRRTFLTVAAPSAAGVIVASNSLVRAADKPTTRAIALDGFTTFDPRPVVALAEQYFPGTGAELGNVWRTRQFEYTWLRTLMGRYANFWQVTEDALVFAANSLKLDLTAGKRSGLMQAFLEIKAWPDAVPALEALKSAGIRLAFLSNLTAQMLDAAVRNSGLEGILEPHLTTDRVSVFKPDPRAYQMGIDAFGLRREEITFAAFGGWDAAGAKTFGYTTFWVNRANTPVEELGVTPDWIGSTLGKMADFILSGQ
jgi:2-haloacid dehalogenase